MGCGASVDATEDAPQAKPVPATATEVPQKQQRQCNKPSVRIADSSTCVHIVGNAPTDAMQQRKASADYQRRKTTTRREVEGDTADSKKGRRQAITAEAQDSSDQDGELTLTPKSIEVAAQITAAFQKHPLFEFLAPRLLEQCIEAMDEQQCEAGVDVITQGSAGDHFYIVSSGTFEAYVQGAGTTLQTFGKSDGFGELALLYDSPRACSVRATTVGVIFALGRRAFRQLVMQHNSGIKHGLERHLATVPMLQELPHEQLAKLADVMCLPRSNHRPLAILASPRLASPCLPSSGHASPRLALPSQRLVCDSLRRDTLELHDGEYIVQMGDAADRLFLVLSGEVVCHREGDEKELQRLSQGNFFGESVCLYGRRPSPHADWHMLSGTC